ncbi:MAG: hypothetical protein M1818_000470 [Claussenomyces sp. TS43310]|nr:MAG: hypothetical protein M1818_000470 [Claussenomyces sp. TS43310]
MACRPRGKSARAPLGSAGIVPDELAVGEQQPAPRMVQLNLHELDRVTAQSRITTCFWAAALVVIEDELAHDPGAAAAAAADRPGGDGSIAQQGIDQGGVEEGGAGGRRQRVTGAGAQGGDDVGDGAIEAIDAELEVAQGAAAGARGQHAEGLGEGGVLVGAAQQGIDVQLDAHEARAPALAHGAQDAHGRGAVDEADGVALPDQLSCLGVRLAAREGQVRGQGCGAVELDAGGLEPRAAAAAAVTAAMAAVAGGGARHQLELSRGFAQRRRTGSAWDGAMVGLGSRGWAGALANHRDDVTGGRDEGLGVDDVAQLAGEVEESRWHSISRNGWAGGGRRKTGNGMAL